MAVCMMSVIMIMCMLMLQHFMFMLVLMPFQNMQNDTGQHQRCTGHQPRAKPTLPKSKCDNRTDERGRGKY